MSLLRKTKKSLMKKLGLSSPSFDEKTSALVSGHASQITAAHSQRSKDKALFIDMGSNLGQGFSYFAKHYNPNIYDYWLIEVNPHCMDQLKGNVSKLYQDNAWQGKWEIKNVAIADKEGTLKLYGVLDEGQSKTSNGASVIEDHNSAIYDASQGKHIEVQAVSVSKLIEDAAQQYPTVVVKMDIESAEYAALESLINTKQIDNIAHIYVEWHSQYFSDEKKAAILKRENKIKQDLGEKMTEWY